MLLILNFYVKMLPIIIGSLLVIGVAMFRHARLDEYIAWLASFIAHGGKPTHYYNYPWQRAGFLVAQGNFTLGGECGSAASPIIVPAGYHYKGGSLGHNNLYFMEGFRHRGFWVPAYKDAAFAGLPGVRTLMLQEMANEAAKRAKKAEWEDERIRRRETSDLSRFRDCSRH